MALKSTLKMMVWKAHSHRKKYKNKEKTSSWTSVVVSYLKGQYYSNLKCFSYLFSLHDPSVFISTLLSYESLKIRNSF